MVLASTALDQHYVKITREALEDAARQINERPTRLLVEHDVTAPPWGRMTHAMVVPEAGEHLLIAVPEAFTLLRQVVLPNGTACLELGSQRDAKALAQRAGLGSDQCELFIDWANFTSKENLRQFIQELEEITDFKRGVVARKSLLPDPEILVQLPLWLVLGDMSRRVLGKVVDRVGDDVAEDAHRAYQFLTRAPAALLRHAVPKNRPATCIYYVLMEPRVEFVVRSRQPQTFIEALDLPRLRELTQDAVELKNTVGAVEVQYLYAEGEGWNFNYLLTETGSVIGTPIAIKRTQQRLQLNFSGANMVDEVEGPPASGSIDNK